MFEDSTTGPLLFGLVVGGVPIGVVLGIWFNRIMDSPPSDNITAAFLLFSFSVASVGAVLGGNHRGRVFFYRAFVASVAMCIPIPLVVDLVLLWKSGTEVFYVGNFPFHAALSVVWSLEATVAGGLLALGYTSFQSWRISHRRPVR